MKFTDLGDNGPDFLVQEGSEERSRNAIWAQITDYEKRAKATANDIKKAHYTKMADELRAKLPTNEAEEDAFVDQLSGLQQWDVMVMNNFYGGKYPDYSARYYSVVASSPEEARQVVVDNADYVLQDLLSRKLQNGKKVLPRGSALPIEDKRVGKAKPGSLTTVGFKKMLSPDGVKSFKFASGKIVDSEEQGVAEGSSNDELNARPGMWRGDAKRMTSKGKPTQDELGMQDNLKNRIKSSNKKGGLTGPKGVLPEEQGVAEGQSQPVKYRATVEYGPTAADAHFVTVTATSTEEAEAKVEAWCKKKGVRNPMITINGADKPHGVTEMDSQGYRGSRDNLEDDAGKKEYYGKVAKPGDVVKQGTKALDNAFNHAEDDWSADFERRMKKGVTEADPHKFDSDVDYYAAQNAPAKPGYRGQQSPGVNPDDEDYFREIFRKKREAAKKAEQGVAEGQLNEYLVRAGMPVQDVLALNLFQDFDPVEGLVAQVQEFAQNKQWQQVVRKYAPIANMLEKKLLAQKRPLTDAEAEAVEETWYDGSDAYDDVEVEYLVNIYDQQIDTLEALLAGNITDEEFNEASLAQMRDYFNQPDNNTVGVDNEYGAPERKKPTTHIPVQIQDLINKMYHVGKITPVEFDTLKRFQAKTGINVGLKIKEAGANPYAIGMSQAMKSTGDKPPLKKSTINKAHEIARAIKKGE